MRLKSAALFALIGMLLLTILLAAGLIRDVLVFAKGAEAAVTLLISGIRFLACLGLTVFLFVFHKTQS